MENLKARFHRRIGLIGLTVLLVCLPAVISNSMALNNGQSNVTRKVKRSPEIQLAVDNSESPAVSVLAASAFQVTANEYAHLTRTSPSSEGYTSLPTCRVTNTTNAVVKAFALGMFNKQSNSLDILRVGSHPLGPFEEFVVQSADWAKARKKSTRTYVHDAGVSREDKSLPGLNSEEMWLPGNVDDFYVYVGEVEFSDGTRWFTKRTR